MEKIAIIVGIIAGALTILKIFVELVKCLKLRKNESRNNLKGLTAFMKFFRSKGKTRAHSFSEKDR